jgi:simple sugar transport system ATP-binding protein
MNYIDIEHCYKSFGGVHALSDVSFSLKTGEVRGLIGENGSGKSTLIKILAGSLKADSGKISLEGSEVDSWGALAGLEKGISVIYQDLSLFPNLTVLENICLCDQVKSKRSIVDKNRYAKKAMSLIEDLDIGVDVNELLGNLTIAKQQLIAIARALLIDSRLLIFDEPTTALTREEINKLFTLINKLKKDNITIIFISHKLDEIMEICDSITVLRDGKHIGTELISNLTIEEIETLMVGKNFKYVKKSESNSFEDEKVVFELKGLTKKNNFKDVSFKLHEGEILGISGLLGSGRTELATAIFGIEPADCGSIEIDGKEINIKNVADAVKAGIAYVPEDRLLQGLVLNYPQRDNMVAPSLKKCVDKRHLINEDKMTEIAQRWTDEIGVKTDSIEKTARTLSGGNQQKIVIAKWLETNPKLLILDGPTVGVDIGAKAGIFSTITDMVEKSGMSVILISDEIRELTANSNRILIMRNGKIAQELSDPKDIDDTYIQNILNKQKRIL